MLEHFALLLALPQISVSRCPYPPAPIPPATSGVFSFCVPATGETETYRVAAPAAFVPNQLYPLVVLFHSFGGDHDEMVEPQGTPFSVWDGYDFATTAVTNGYIVVMHDGGWDHIGGHKTYGSEAFHRHTEMMMSRVFQSFAGIIDKDRVYAYGLSLGGGNATNYSARHQDPLSNHGMFAAVLNHSGALSSPMWFYSWQNPQTFLTGLYGTDHSVDPLPYQMASLFESVCPITDMNCLPPVGQRQCDLSGVDLSRSLMNNLYTTPLHTYYSNCDANDNITEQNGILDQFMSNSPTYQTTDTMGPHRWDSVASMDVLNFFAPHTLMTQTHAAKFGRNLFVEDNKRHIHFKVLRSDPVAEPFGDLAWSINNNRVNVYDPGPTATLARVDVIVDQYTPLDTGIPLQVHHDKDMKIRVSGYVNPPASITKSTGTVVPGDWAHLPNLQMVVLNKSGGNTNTLWTITP